EKTIGLARLRPGDDAFEMPAHESGDLLHRLDLGAHHAAAPVLERAAHDVDLLATEDLAQPLLVGPGAGRARQARRANQPVQRRTGLRAQAEDVLEQRPAHALQSRTQRRVVALLDAP